MCDNCLENLTKRKEEKDEKPKEEKDKKTDDEKDKKDEKDKLTKEEMEKRLEEEKKKLTQDERDKLITEEWEKLMNDVVRREVLWGINYRKSQQKPLPPKKSPLVLPMDKCRKKQYRAQKFLKDSCKKCKKSLKKQLEKRCRYEPLSPRLAELAMPSKRLVLANWKCYQNLLPVEVLLRYDQMMRIKDKKNLEPHLARYYFKLIDKRKRKKMLKRRKTLLKRAKKSILMKNIKQLVNCFVSQLMEKPLAILSHRQLTISEQLLEIMTRSRILKTKPKRTTTKPYKKSILEISDKVADWIWDINKVVDIDPEVLKRHLAMLELMKEEPLSEAPSEIKMIEEEEEAEEEEEGEKEEGESEEEVEAVGGEERTFLDEFLEQEGLDFEDLDDDILNRLIAILSSCPPDFLETFFNEDLYPDVTYNDVLEKLKEIRDKKLVESGDKPIVEQILIEWAKRCDPTKVDSKILKKIHETAYILQDLLAAGERQKKAIEGGDGYLESVHTILNIGDTDELLYGLMGAEAGDAGEDEGDTTAGTLEDELLDEVELGMEDIVKIVEEEEVVEISEEEFLEAESEEVSESSEEELIEEKPKVEMDVREEAFGDRIIYGHEAPLVLDHSPDAICCLSLKVWAVWLLEIAQNAQNWSKWILETVKQVRYYVSVIRGDVVVNGKKQVLYKAEWRKFSARNVEMVEAWKRYSAHVRELSNEIFGRFSGKEVKCCPKCLQDHLIRDVAVAHGTFVALAEAINCAGYWHRCLDGIVQETSRLNKLDEAKFQEEKPPSEKSSEESGDYEIEQIDDSDDDDDEYYIIEEPVSSDDSDDNPRQFRPCNR